MSRWDDSHLWEQMAAATTEQERKQVAAAVVEFHLGFIRQYSSHNALRSWSSDTREQFFQECVIVAMERAMQYDPTHIGARGKATFPSYLRPFLQPVRWKVESLVAGPMSLSIETKRLQWGAAAVRQAKPDASYREIAHELSVTHGKQITTPRIGRLLNPPRFESIDKPLIEDPVGREPFAKCLADTTVAGEDPAEQVIRQMERDAAAALVQELLELAGPFTPVERVLLVERLLAPPRLVDASGEVINPGPASLRSIGQRFGVSSERIRQKEKRLLERMRSYLADA